MTIAEICKKYQITRDTLRYYVRIGVTLGGGINHE